MPTVSGGSSLPTPALRRLERVRDGSAAGSSESLAGTAGLVVAGFDAVTEVMGCTVVHLGLRLNACGTWSTGLNARARTAGTGVRARSRARPFATDLCRDCVSQRGHRDSSLGVAVAVVRTRQPDGRSLQPRVVRSR